MTEFSTRRMGGRSSRMSERQARRDDRSMLKETAIKASFAPLSAVETESVHRAALQVLERVGMANATPRALDAAQEHGCWQDDTGRLRFPPALVEDCLAKAAKSFTVFGRSPEYDFEVRNGEVNFATGGAAVKMLDREERTYRPSTLADSMISPGLPNNCRTSSGSRGLSSQPMSPTHLNWMSILSSPVQPARANT